MSSKITVEFTEKAPRPVGPYSQSIKAKNFDGILFISGQLGIDPTGANGMPNGLEDGLENQTRRALQNLIEVLLQQNLTLRHIAKTTVFMANLGDFPVFNKIYAEFFSDHKPARSTVGVSALPLGALVELEAIAIFE